jgi:hypothetical protein
MRIHFDNSVKHDLTPVRMLLFGCQIVYYMCLMLADRRDVLLLIFVDIHFDNSVMHDLTPVRKPIFGCQIVCYMCLMLADRHVVRLQVVDVMCCFYSCLRTDFS